MKLVIDISEEDYIMMKLAYESGMGNSAMKRILQGTPIEQINTAEWLSQNGEYVCSECGYEVWGSGISVMNEWKYCPNCGARCVDKKKGGIE